MKSNYYQATTPSLNLPELIETLETQVCVIGAGFAGLATALGLLERGIKNVVILEAEHVGYGASGRNGGFVFGGFSLDQAQLIRQIGKTKARQLYQLTLDAVELIRKRIDQYQIDCELDESGVLLANWFDDEKSLLKARDFMRAEFDVEWTHWNREKTRAALNTDRYFGALHEAQAFHFHPLKYANGCAQKLRAAGVQIFEHSRVLSIEKQAAKTCLRTANGQVNAQHVVIACGGYIEKLAPELASQLARAVLPIATYVMATEALGDRLASVMQTTAAVYDTRFAFDYYRPMADTRILWGGRISIFDKTPEQVQALLQADMLKVYPQLRDVKAEFAWSGLMSYGRHKMPQIGQLENGLWYALGFGGHGVAPTTLAGEVLAQAIANGRALPQGFSHYGLPRTFGPLGMLAAQCSYWYYELRDYLRA